MKTKSHFLSLILILLLSNISIAQDYYFKDKAPFDKNIPTPEEYLGYKVGEHHTCLLYTSPSPRDRG